MSDGSARAPEADRRPSTFAALRHRDYRLLIAGLTISNTGVWMQTFAVGWHLVQLAVRDGVPERAPLYLGLVGASRAIPGLTAGLFAGTFSDRVADRRRMLLGVQIGGGLIAAVLAALAFADRLGVVPLMIATAASGIVGAFDSPSRQGMVPRLVPNHAISSAVGLMLSIQNLATLTGPLIGGLLIGSIGVPGLLLANALSFLAVIGAVLLMRPVPGDAAGRRANVLRSMGEGFVYVWRDPFIRPLFIVLVIMALFARALTQMLPAVAENALHVGAIQLSWLLAGSGVGAFLGSVFSASLGGFSRRGIIVISGAAGSGALLILVALQSAILPAVAAAALASFAIQVHITNHVTLYQLRSPSYLQGRVVGVSSSLSGSGAALGALIVGSLGTLFGIQMALAIAGGVVIVAVLWVLSTFPRLRDPVVRSDPLQSGVVAPTAGTASR